MSEFKIAWWLRAGSLVKVIFFEYVALFCLASFLTTVAVMNFSWYSCPTSGSLGWSDIAFLLIGLASAAWVIWRVLFPVLIKDSFRPILKIGWLIIPNPRIGSAEYLFPSTHPSYFFVDLFATGVGLIFFLSLGASNPAVVGCGLLREHIFSNIALMIGIFFPVLRLVSWYVLRRQFPAETALGRPAWKPVVILWSIIAVPFGIVLISMGIQSMIRKPVALPVVDANTFTGGLSAHTNFDGTYVRVRGTMKYPEVIRCGCDNTQKTNCIWRAATLLDIGDGGEVLAVATQDIETVYAATDAAREKKINGMVELIGKLQTMPDATEKPWTFSTCGAEVFGTPGAAGRAYLLVEEPVRN